MTNNTHPTPFYQEDILTQASKSVYHLLTDLLSRNYNETLADILKSYAQNRTADGYTYTANRIAELNEQHEQTKQTLAECRKNIRRLTTPTADRPIWDELEHETKRQADQENEELKTLENNSTNYTDFQDLVQVWCIAYLYDEPKAEHWERAAEIVEEHYSDLDEDEQTAIVSNLAHRKNAKRAVNNYIRKQATATGLDTFHTKSRPATDEELKSWFASGKELDTKYIKANGTDKEQIRWNGKKNRFEYTLHYVTAKQGNSIEQLNENGDISAYIRNRNTYAETFADLERIEELLTACNLTDKQQQFINAFCGATARTKGQHARTEYFEQYATTQGKHNPKEFRNGLSKAEYNARKEHAFNIIGITASNRKSEFFAKLKKTLASYNFVSTDGQTAHTLTERNILYFEHLAQTNHGNGNGNRGKAVDLVKWTHRPSTPHKPIIAWLDKEQAEQRAEQRAEQLAEYYASIEPPTAKTLAEYEQTRRQAEQTRREQTAKAVAEIRATELKSRKPRKERTAEEKAKEQAILKFIGY